MKHGLDNEPLNPVLVGGQEHRDPGRVFCPGTFWEYRDRKHRSGFYMDRRHPDTGIIPSVVSRQRVYNIGA